MPSAAARHRARRDSVVGLTCIVRRARGEPAHKRRDGERERHGPQDVVRPSITLYACIDCPGWSARLAPTRQGRPRRESCTSSLCNARWGRSWRVDTILCSVTVGSAHTLATLRGQLRSIAAIRRAAARHARRFHCLRSPFRSPCCMPRTPASYSPSPNPSIERTSASKLRLLPVAAHVERWAS
jgi:hypothetical protein